MAAWRYKISLLVLKKYFTSERSERVKYFSTLEEKFRISKRPCNILYFFPKVIATSHSGRFHVKFQGKNRYRTNRFVIPLVSFL